MSFEQDYKKILQHAKSKVAFFRLNIEPDDLVNDAYVAIFEQQYSFELVCKQINNFALQNKHGEDNTVEFGVKASVNGKFIGDHYCAKCHEIKPASEFRVDKKPGKKAYLRTECRECQNKKSNDTAKKRRCNKPKGSKYNKKYYLKIKNTRGYKNKNRERVAKFVSNNKDNWNNYISDRYQQDKENITDNYIKKLCRNKYPEITPEIIVIERSRIIRKRFAKLKKVS